MLYKTFVKIGHFIYRNKLSKKILRDHFSKKLELEGKKPKKLRPYEEDNILRFWNIRIFEYAMEHGYFQAIRKYELPIRLEFNWDELKVTLKQMDALKEKLIIEVTEEDYERLEEWSTATRIPISEGIWKNIFAKEFFQIDKLTDLRNQLKEALEG